MLSQTVREATAANGRLAAQTALPVTECPFDANGTPLQQALAAIWIRAYLAARPPLPTEINYDEEQQT